MNVRLFSFKRNSFSFRMSDQWVIFPLEPTFAEGKHAHFDSTKACYIKAFIYRACTRLQQKKKKNYIFNQFNWYWQLLLHDLPFSLNVAFDGPSRGLCLHRHVRPIVKPKARTLSVRWYNMVPLNRAANTRRFLLRLRLFAVRAARENAGVWSARARLRKQQRGAYRQVQMGGKGGEMRKRSDRKAVGRSCRISIRCHVSQYQQKKKARRRFGSVGALPNERNSTSDGRASMLSHRPS